jgi:hypothetical protein
MCLYRIGIGDKDLFNFYSKVTKKLMNNISKKNPIQFTNNIRSMKRIH